MLCSCSEKPSTECINEGLSMMQQTSFSETPNKKSCEWIKMIMVARTNNACSLNDTFGYIANNAEEIINNSVLAGIPDNDKKNEITRWTKAAAAIVGTCQF